MNEQMKRWVTAWFNTEMDDSVCGNFYSTSCCHCAVEGSHVIYHSSVTQ